MKVARLTAFPWRNQKLVLYHGTVGVHVKSILKRVKLMQWHDASDFGLGFYTTTSLLQAQRFAAYKSRRTGGPPVVVSFTIERSLLSKLDSLWFVRHANDADDFWQLVESCRTGETNRTKGLVYDIVIGPVARDYESRLAWEQYDRVSFHTEQAFALLDNSNKGVI